MSRGTTLAFVFALCLPPLSSQADSVTIQGREYRTVLELAETYDLEASPDREESDEYGFASEKHSLIVKIDHRQVIIDGVRHWLSFPVKAGKDDVAMISVKDIKSTLDPAFDPTEGGKLRKVETVVFDPGHGGYDKGGKSVYGLEKTYVLDVVNRTRKILEGRDIKVVQSRLGDSFPTLSARTAMLKNYKNPIFVSVHFNAAGWRPAAEGYEIFSLAPLGAPSTGAASSKRDHDKRPGDAYVDPSFVLSNTIYQSLIGKLPAFDRGVKRARYQVLRYAKAPAVLVEGGFLTNPNEAKLIHSSEWRGKFSVALADAIDAYIQFANKGDLPPRAIDLDHEPTDEFVPES